MGDSTTRSAKRAMVTTINNSNGGSKSETLKKQSKQHLGQKNVFLCFFTTGKRRSHPKEQRRREIRRDRIRPRKRAASKSTTRRKDMLVSRRGVFANFCQVVHACFCVLFRAQDSTAARVSPPHPERAVLESEVPVEDFVWVLTLLPTVESSNE